MNRHYIQPNIMPHDLPIGLQNLLLSVELPIEPNDPYLTINAIKKKYKINKRQYLNLINNSMSL